MHRLAVHSRIAADTIKTVELPEKFISMKPRNIIVLVLCIVVVAGIWQFRPRREAQVVQDPGGEKPPPARPAETPAEREARWLREAKTAFAAAITNDVPGYKRTVRTEDTIVTNKPVSNWTASAVVEYVDKNGNFGRSTFYWKFEVNADEVRIILVPY